jgi:hypothetical protein
MSRPLEDEQTVIKPPRPGGEESGPTLRPARQDHVPDTDAEEAGDNPFDGEMSGERTVDVPRPAPRRRPAAVGARAPSRKKKSRVLPYVVAGVLAAAGLAVGALYFLHLL